MFFHAVRLSPGRLALCAGSLLALFSLTVGSNAVEMEADLHGARGQLKPADRLTTPEVDPASDEGKLALTRMQLPAGLTATLWAAEPMLANPVAFNFDERGRIFVSETYRYRTSTLDIRDYMWMLEDDLADRNQADFMASIRRNFGETGVADLSKESERVVLLEDTKGKGVADKSSVYADNFRTPIDGIASGVMARHGEVWFTNIPSLWKFTGKDKAETRTELLKGFGVRFSFTGHDFHGLIFGPDGRIYFSIGDRAASVTTKEGTQIEAPDTGSVFRCWPDGSQLELFATGLRNPQSLLFNEFGDLFTGDNDSDQGDEERLVHIVENGDSGWRIGYQHAPLGNAGPWNAEKLWLPRHKTQPAYLLPPICNIEDGPSGIAYYPGTGLTPAYSGNIFVTHFKGAINRSGIFTYKVKPAGATYAIADAAPFLTNALPTDVRFGPDGRLYYSDWAEGWPKSKKGRIYAISDPRLASDPLVKSTQQLIASDYSMKAEGELVSLLAHPDWRVRLDAQYALAERGAGSIGLLSGITAQVDSNPLARRHAVWALGQLADKNPSAIEALRPLLHSADAEIRAQAAKQLGDHHDSASAAALVAALTDSSARVKFFAAQSLGKLKHTAATPALFAAIRANNDKDAYLRHALVMGLVGCATPEQLSACATDQSRAVRLAAVLALRRLGHADAAKFLTDTDLFIAREAAEAINDAPIVASYPALAALVAKSISDEAIMLRAINVNFRLGTAENAAALASYAANEAAPEALRKEALTLLALWPKPPARDRIVGIYRPLAEKSRPAEIAAQALVSHLNTLLADAAPESVQSATINATVALRMTSATPALHAVVASIGEIADLRAAALNALDKLGDPQLASAVAIALTAEPPELRLAALPLSSRIHPESAMATLTALLAKGSPLEQRAVFKSLGESKDSAADAILLNQLSLLAAGKIAPGAQLELLDAAALRSDLRVKQALADRDAALAKDPDPLAAFRVCLEGGNAEASKKTFVSQPVLQCIRCHSVGEFAGGEAGPNLGGIGARATREYILESIIKPSAKIAPGFEIITITKKNDEAIVGTLVYRDDKLVRLRSGETGTMEIPQSDIKSIVSAPSAMPEVAALVLTKTEIRDLVEGLALLTTPYKPSEKSPIRALRPAAE